MGVSVPTTTSGQWTSTGSAPLGSPGVVDLSINTNGKRDNGSNGTSSETGNVLSLKLDDCRLQPSALEVLGTCALCLYRLLINVDITAKFVRHSTLRHISLRHNKISSTGAVPLAVMIRDYPDYVSGPGSGVSLATGLSGALASPPASPRTTSPAFHPPPPPHI